MVENSEDKTAIATSSMGYVPVWVTRPLCFIRLLLQQCRFCSLKAFGADFFESSLANDTKKEECEEFCFVQCFEVFIDK